MFGSIIQHLFCPAHRSFNAREMCFCIYLEGEKKTGVWLSADAHGSCDNNKGLCEGILILNYMLGT